MNLMSVMPMLALVTCLMASATTHAETDGMVFEPAAFERSVWDISTALLTVDLIDALKAVRDTHDLIKSKGATPDMVVLFRSMSDKQVARAEQRGRMISPAIMEEARRLFAALAALPGAGGGSCRAGARTRGRERLGSLVRSLC